ncbi:hexokinase type 2-like [Scaptodrosophila lebanonensis]|uniref:Phosphotransferase n=1 Tax=Drosophila lebanonensis TaxID=7225 RepID=A0A6J2TML9_DROLE|nr:hexokinase type 2-like [Scaptodrosophila lebanonensis]
MQEVIDKLSNEIQKGLSKQMHSRSTVKCWPTYVQDLPTQNERGKYLALDLGGTNFRVLLVSINGPDDVDIQTQAFQIAQPLMACPASALFDFIAECLDNFVKEKQLSDKELSLGFTFSFPMRQLSLAEANLVTWTKGFSCDEVVGKNVTKLLQESISRRGTLKVNIVAIINDTTGALISCAYNHKNCRIGLIVGTGCNACYVEKTCNVEMFEDYQTSQKPNMIINCEWGAFGDNGVLDNILTSFDRMVDKQTPNQGKQIFEKCVSGMYLGELVRIIIVKLMEEGKLFNGIESSIMHENWKFETKFISAVESDPPGIFEKCNEVLNECCLNDASDEDKACLRYICETISTRSAKLVACGLVTLINKMEICDLSVGIDGSLYRRHPKYHDLLMDNVKKYVGTDVCVQFFTSDDGSGRGAALVAALYKDNKSKKCK